jgi:D-glucosaminate-6-phosphate ammonia-lyase
MNIYEQRGVPTIINAAGTLTRLSGGVMRDETIAAMAAASAHAVEIDVLQAHASTVIAGVTGAEAGYVASGAAACLLISTAACMTGLDAVKMGSLPDTGGMKDEVIVARGHRNGYDRAVRAAGAVVVEVGLPDRASGAGVRDAEPWEYAAAITEKTAAVLWVAGRHARPAFPDVVAVAHSGGVPVIVDAAAQLPPQANLRRFVEQGADLVVFSGGKAIGGPQASGFLCGRRELAMSAALQHLDLDVLPEFWEPPAALIDRQVLTAIPRHGIGRSCKAGKEEIIGLLTALELFVAEGDAQRHARWLADLRRVAAKIGQSPRLEPNITDAENPDNVPLLELRMANGDASEANALARFLRSGPLSVHVDASLFDRGILIVNPVALHEGQAELVGQKLKAFGEG